MDRLNSSQGKFYHLPITTMDVWGNGKLSSTITTVIKHSTYSAPTWNAIIPTNVKHAPQRQNFSCWRIITYPVPANIYLNASHITHGICANTCKTQFTPLIHFVNFLMVLSLPLFQDHRSSFLCSILLLYLTLFLCLNELHFLGTKENNPRKIPDLKCLLWRLRFKRAEPR